MVDTPFLSTHLNRAYLKTFTPFFVDEYVLFRLKNFLENLGKSFLKQPNETYIEIAG